MTHGAVAFLFFAFLAGGLLGALAIIGFGQRVRADRRSRSDTGQPSLGVSSLNWPGCVSSVSGPFSEGIR